MIIQNFTCSLKSAKTAHKETRLGKIKILRTKFKSKKRKLNLKSEKPTSTITSKNKGGPDLSKLDWIPLPTDNRPEYTFFILHNFAIFLNPAISRVFYASPHRCMYFPRWSDFFKISQSAAYCQYIHTGNFSLLVGSSSCLI